MVYFVRGLFIFSVSGDYEVSPYLPESSEELRER